MDTYTWETLRDRVYGLDDTERRLVLAYLLGYATDAVEVAIQHLDHVTADD